jgi:hypothetical protein
MLACTRLLKCGRVLASRQFPRRSRFSTHRSPLVVSEEVADAIQCKKPVVALETTIYTHGKLFSLIVLDSNHARISLSGQHRAIIFIRIACPRTWRGAGNDWDPERYC